MSVARLPITRTLVLAGLLAAGVACKKQGDAQPPAADAGAPGADPAPGGDAAAQEEEESPYLDVANFNRRMEEHTPEIVGCYRDTVGGAADAPTGRVKVTIIVDGDGGVKKVTFDDQRSTLKHEALFGCIQARAKDWKFNITLTGAETPMPYTFDLTAGGLLAK
jgi:hypothetical protein